ncbi:hypothetical protein [Mycobacterium sp. C31M]
MDDADEHPGVKIMGWILMAVFVAGMGIHLWIANEQDRRDAWDIVPIGARCETLGAEERTYDDRPVYCVAFPDYGLQVWSWRQVDLQAPVPAPAGPFEAQVRVCMHQAQLDERNCAAAIRQYEGR